MLLYWKGCMSRYRTKSIIEAIEKILSYLNIKYITLEDEGCCGSILYRTGQIRDALKITEKNIEKFKSLGIKEIITSCPGCLRTISKDYSNYYNISFKIYHFSQFLLKFKELLKLKELNAIVTYHDPCHLGRHVGVFDEPREVLANIPGLKFIEFERTAHNAWCCGAGAGVMSGFPELARFAATERLKEAKGIGANYISSTCPFCELNLKRAEDVAKLGIEIGDILQLLEKSLR